MNSVQTFSQSLRIAGHIVPHFSANSSNLARAAASVRRHLRLELTACLVELGLQFLALPLEVCALPFLLSFQRRALTGELGPCGDERLPRGDHVGADVRCELAAGHACSTSHKVVL